MRRLVYGAALIAAFLMAQRAHAQEPIAALPDAPSREVATNNAGDSSSLGAEGDARDSQPRASDAGARPLASASMYVRPVISSRTCASGEAAKHDCHEHWAPLMRQSVQFLLLQHGMNLALDQTNRYNISHGHWLDHWTYSFQHEHLSHWNDGDSFLTNYIGHPMMGAVTDFLYIQNDPRGRDLSIGANRAYWMSRLRAMAFSTVYAAQWEVGPISEASIGNEGKDIYYSKSSHGLTNGTGAVDFVMTPVAGTAWSVGEDLIDRQIIWRLEGHTNNRGALLAMSVLNPNRSVANMLRGKAPWYRDNRPMHVPKRLLPFQQGH